MLTNGEIRAKDILPHKTSFSAGDGFYGDGPQSFFMEATQLLELTSQNALKGNVVPAFDPTRTSENPYKIGDVVVFDGKLKVFIATHYGNWNNADVIDVSCADIFIKMNRYCIFSQAYDLNDVPDNSVKFIIRSYGTPAITNLPSDFGALSTGFLASYLLFTESNVPNRYQILTRWSDGKVWKRNKYLANPWSAWSSTEFATADQLDADTVARVRHDLIFSQQTDLNDCPDNTSVVIYRAPGQPTPTNLPADFGVSQGVLMTYRAYVENSSAVNRFQVLTRFGSGDMWFRSKYLANAWTDWTHYEPPTVQTVIKIGPNQQYTTLRAGFAAARNVANARVVVYPDVYDLETEFYDILHGEVPWSNTGYGLGNGMSVYFYDGAKIVADFDAADYTSEQFANINQFTSPFWVFDGDFELNNVTVEARNCRYCVHDELGGHTTPYRHVYNNCKMKMAYDDNDYNYVQCIGGGLGEHATIIIDGGVFESVPSRGLNGICNADVDYAQMCISYHNNNNWDQSSSESSVTIKNIVCKDKGYVAALPYGSSSIVSNMYVNACKFGLPPMVRSGNNMRITEWGNVTDTAGTWTNVGTDTNFSPAN